MQQNRSHQHPRSMLASFVAILVIVTTLVYARTSLVRAQDRPAPAAPAVTAVELAVQGLRFENPTAPPGKGVFTAEDEAFLDDLQKRGIRFFMDEADPVTGLMPDRSRANGGPANDVASTASVGFGLTALCVGVERGWVERQDAYDRCLKVLKFLNEKVPNHHGHYFHFLNMRTGERVWNCEVSNIDTALLMTGIVTVKQYFPDTELSRLAQQMFDRVEWDWLLDESNNLMRAGWKPETGFLNGHWGAYSECSMLVALIGLGSKTHPLPPQAWTAWRREPVMSFAGLTFVQCPPLFTHQYPQVWFDLRGLDDGKLNYFRNSRLATIVQRQWSMDELSRTFPTYGPNVWGLTASDSERGYVAWGGPPAKMRADDEDVRRIDGSVVPCAAAGSLAFEPRITLDALIHLKAKFGEKGYVKYGFVDALNPATGWYNPDVIGIDVGPTVLMAENARSGFVWKTFMSSPEAQRALKQAGFRPAAPITNNATTAAITSLVGGGAIKGSAGAGGEGAARSAVESR